MFYQLGIHCFPELLCYTFNINIIEKYFLIFRSSLTQIFCCFLYATCDNIVLSCLNLFNNYDIVMITFFFFSSYLHMCPSYI